MKLKKSKMGSYSLENGHSRFLIETDQTTYNVVHVNQWGGNRQAVLKDVPYPSLDAYPGGVEESWWMLDVMHRLSDCGHYVFEKAQYGIHSNKKVKITTHEDEITLMIDGCYFVGTIRSIHCPFWNENNAEKHQAMYCEIHEWLSYARKYIFYPTRQKVLTLEELHQQVSFFESGLMNFLEMWAS